MRIIETFREVFTGSLYRERKLLSKLRQMARNKEFDVLIINTFDRLSRNQTHLAVLIDEMDHLGIKIECVKENFDDTAAGQFMRSAMGFVAEVQRQKIIENTDAGRYQRVHLEKKLIPGTKAVFGYHFDNDKVGQKNTYIINEEEAELVRRIFRLYINGGTMRGIANLLNDEKIPTPSGKGYWVGATIYRFLIDTTYIGQARTLKWDAKMDHTGKTRRRLRPASEHVILPVPAIIDEATFQQVQELLEINKVNCHATTLK